MIFYCCVCVCFLLLNTALNMDFTLSSCCCYCPKCSLFCVCNAHTLCVDSSCSSILPLFHHLRKFVATTCLSLSECHLFVPFGLVPSEGYVLIFSLSYTLYNCSRYVASVSLGWAGEGGGHAPRDFGIEKRVKGPFRFSIFAARRAEENWKYRR